MHGGKLALLRLGPWGALIAVLGLAWLLARLAGPQAINALVAEWYAVLNHLYLAVGIPLNDLARDLNVPLVSAFVFGIIGALSPCQLSTGGAALAYLAPRSSQPGRFSLAIAAYVGGKILTYSLLGGAVLLAGFQFNDSIPVVQTVRKALGPLMLLLALQFVGVIRFSFAPGQRLGQWFEERFAGSGTGGAFALGIAFSLAFCPTLFLLFFGLLLPLALTSPLGVLYPGLFAVGTTLPLLLLAFGLAAGRDSAGGMVRKVGSIDRAIRWVAAAVLLAAGLNDTVVYWFV